MNEILLSLLISCFEFYLISQFYAALWLKRPHSSTRVTCVVVLYVAMALLAALPVTRQYALYWGIISCVAVGGLFQISLLWNLLCTFSFILLLCIGEIISGALLLKFSGPGATTAEASGMFALAGMLFSKLIALVIIKVIELCRKGAKSSDGLYRSPISLLIAAYSCIMLYFIANYVKFEHRPLILLIAALLLAVIILSNIFLMDLLANMYQAQLREETARTAQEAMYHEVRHYQNLLDKQKEIYRILHDTRNQLTAVMGVLHAGEADEAYRMLGEMTRVETAAESCHPSGNPAIDAIINANLTPMRDGQIRYTQFITMPEVCKIKYDDLAIIMGNIFDNAIRVCADVSDESARFIELNIQQMKAYLCISMKNAVQETADAPQEETRQDDRPHGFGLRNIQSVAQHYDGFVKTVCEPQTFSIFIMLLNDPQTASEDMPLPQ